MTQPLALIFYERLMPGSQLVNRLQDLNYRVQVVGDLASFHSCAQDERPLLAIVDLAGGDAVCNAIAALKPTPPRSTFWSLRSPMKRRWK